MHGRRARRPAGRLAALDLDRQADALAVAAFVLSRGGGQHWKNGALPFGRFFEKYRKQVETLADVTRADAEAYRAHRDGKVGPSTLRKDLIFARSLFTWARREKLIATDLDPFDGVKLPKKPAPRDYALDNDAEAKLLAAITMPWLRAVVVWLIGTGMDRGEVCALRWNQINSTDGVVDAPRAKTGVRRPVFLTPTLRALLDDAAKVRHVSGLVFLDGDHQPIANPDRISLALKRTYERAGLDVPNGGPVTILRHTFATRVQRATGDIRVTQELLGHADPRQTMRYAHVTDDAKRNAVLAASGGAA